MLIFILILAAAIIIVIAIHHSISMESIIRINELEGEKQRIVSKYEFLRTQKEELDHELAEKEHRLATLRNSGDGIKTGASVELPDDDEPKDSTGKTSNYLIRKGLISLEQSEKAMGKMKTLGMDFLSTCLTLGYIDLDAAKATSKATKITNERIKKH
ncbi:hypothetical protein [Pseudodesulfovibrio sp.]|uniref:hypothetical protein n=1 Tax=unclassified Pseudodesulfovibrio TaxID=2661612 RepID=UPI003B004F4C